MYAIHIVIDMGGQDPEHPDEDGRNKNHKSGQNDAHDNLRANSLPGFATQKKRPLARSGLSDCQTS